MVTFRSSQKIYGDYLSIFEKIMIMQYHLEKVTHLAPISLSAALTMMAFAIDFDVGPFMTLRLPDGSNLCSLHSTYKLPLLAPRHRIFPASLEWHDLFPKLKERALSVRKRPYLRDAIGPFHYVDGLNVVSNALTCQPRLQWPGELCDR